MVQLRVACQLVGQHERFQQPVAVQLFAPGHQPHRGNSVAGQLLDVLGFNAAGRCAGACAQLRPQPLPPRARVMLLEVGAAWAALRVVQFEPPVLAIRAALAATARAVVAIRASNVASPACARASLSAGRPTCGAARRTAVARARCVPPDGPPSRPVVDGLHQRCGIDDIAAIRSQSLSVAWHAPARCVPLLCTAVLRIPRVTATRGASRDTRHSFRRIPSASSYAARAGRRACNSDSTDANTWSTDSSRMQR